jgi:hypothetical protein|tara:strand:+ start:230 stop:523 length:294 start_codon:yes stop_codon:yes gene_type:complete
MITGNMLIMFIVGFIIFCFYIAGLIYAIYWGHSTQRKEMMNDPELQNYYNRHHNYDADIDWSKHNPHVDKSDSYVKNLFKPKRKTKKENVGKSTFWD